MDIELVEVSSKEIAPNESSKTLSIFGQLEGHNVIVHCKSDQLWKGLYGIERSYKVLLLHLDEPKKFQEYLSQIKSGDAQNS